MSYCHDCYLLHYFIRVIDVGAIASNKIRWKKEKKNRVSAYQLSRTKCELSIKFVLINFKLWLWSNLKYIFQKITQLRTNIVKCNCMNRTYIWSYIVYAIMTIGRLCTMRRADELCYKSTYDYLITKY
jgi:hypothetical protein